MFLAWTQKPNRTLKLKSLIVLSLTCGWHRQMSRCASLGRRAALKPFRNSTRISPDMQFELEPDIPDLVAALATHFALKGFTAQDACIVVVDMLAEAMEGTGLH